MVSIAACLSVLLSHWSPGNKFLRKRFSQPHFSGVLFSMQRGLLVGDIRAAVFDQSSIWFQWGLGFLHPWPVGAHLEARVVNST